MSDEVEVRGLIANSPGALQQPPLLRHFDLLATAHVGMARLRELILALAIQGKLVPQEADAKSAKETLERSRALMRERMLAGIAKKEKPPAVVTDDEVPFSLPNGWQWCRLTDTGEYVNGLAFKESDFQSDGLPVIRIQNLSGRSADFNRVKGDFPASVLVKDGDILVSWSATLDAFIWRGEAGVLNQHIFRVEPSPAVDKRFLYWLLKWAIRDLAASDHAHGLVMSHINRGPFLSKPIALPSLAEQARIVTRVEELMRLCDALEAKGKLVAQEQMQLVQVLLDALTRSTSPEELAGNWQCVSAHFDLLLDRPETVDALEQTILQLAVRGLLVSQDPQDEPAGELLKKIRAEKDRLAAKGSAKREKPFALLISDSEKAFELPEGWEWVRVGQISSRVQYGITASADHSASLPKFVRITDIQDDQVNWETVPGLQGVKQDFEGHHLRSGDLLIARTGGTIGKSFLVSDVPVRAVFASYLIRISPIRGVESRYLKVFASSAHYWQQLYAKSMGTGQPNVNGTALSELTLPLPPLAEQLRIVDKVESLRRLCADLRERLVARQDTQVQLAGALVAEVA